MTIDDSIREALWGDYDHGEDYPDKRPLLAHYTSTATLEQIITNNELWLSNPLYMNDWEELRFGMISGANEFRYDQRLPEACGAPRIHGALTRTFDELFESFNHYHAIDIYVLCFSEHHPDDNDGLLSMWRGYGEAGSGVAMVIDTGKITAVDGAPLIIGKVQYATQQKRLDWIRQKLGALATVIANSDKSIDALTAIASAWFQRLKLFSLFTKHVGFSEEREWRLVYFKERDPDLKLASLLSYSISSKGVEPKLKLKLASLKEILGIDVHVDGISDRILLGPSISSDLSSLSVQRMLHLTGHSALAEKTVVSTIPYRP